MFTDTHCHLSKEFFDDVDMVIKNAKSNGVYRVISDADSVNNCYEMLELASDYDNIYITLGIHPQNLGDDFEELVKIVEDNLDNKKVIAIGEIGLDYYYGKDNKEQQISLFEKQLKLAEKYNYPVVVHSREATLDTINCLKKYKVKGVIHCFSGSLETAKEYIKMGFLIGIGGVMTFKNSKIDEVIKEIPLENLMLETDAPFLTPEPFRKYKNEPKYIKIIAEYLSNLKGLKIEEISQKTEENIKEIFDI